MCWFYDGSGSKGIWIQNFIARVWWIMFKYGHSSWLSGDNPFGYQFEERKRRSRRKLIVLRHSWPLKKIRHFDSHREACSQWHSNFVNEHIRVFYQCPHGHIFISWYSISFSAIRAVACVDCFYRFLFEFSFFDAVTQR